MFGGGGGGGGGIVFWIVFWKAGVCSVLNSVMSVRLLGENYVFDIPSKHHAEFTVRLV